MWDFETDPEFADDLAWTEEFVTNEVMPLDALWPHETHRTPTGALVELIPPLKAQVRERGLWGFHLSRELGGVGRGQIHNALLNEILGRSNWAPVIFGSQAPDSGNAEILAHFGTPDQKERYLRPLLDGEIFSSFSMTEPHGGADPKVFTTRAERDGDEWVINGEKYFSSNAAHASFLIVMAVTNPDVSPYKGMSMFVVPTDTAGIEIVRNPGVYSEEPGEGNHAYVRYNDVRVPLDAMLGGEGQAFVVAQTRLGGGRIHHAMRTVGMAKWALDMMCRRALSRTTQGGLLAEKQSVQNYIADSWAQLEMFRLFVLQTAWKIDRYNDYARVRKDIAAVKVMLPQVLHDIASRAMQIHGALGISNEMPLGRMLVAASSLGVADGPSEVHRVTVARQVLADYRPYDGLWPPELHATRVAEAEAKFAGAIERAKRVN
jgi:acyl-CoA dehydrogenase